MVSSGAIALGVERLKLPSRPKDIPGKQACAAVGQSRLMQAYEEAFGRAQKVVAQVLLTHDDVQDRRRYLNAKHALARLISQQVVPIINENDTVSVDEIKFGDNDTLAGWVAGLVEADALIILSDVDGIFEEDPRKNPDARRMPLLNGISEEVLARATGTVSGLGQGGMATKVRAVARASEMGVRSVITSGNLPGRLREALSGADVGTLIEPLANRRHSRWVWIAHALRPQGRIVVDEGARRAVVGQKASLLPSGILKVEGQFTEGDPVELVDASGTPFGRGLCAYGAEDLRKIAGKKSTDIESLLGYRVLDEAIHRDDLAVLSESA